MTQVKDYVGKTLVSTEDLFWNESNQLQADHNLGGLHHFMYDSSGERYLKGTLLFTNVGVDGRPVNGTSVTTSDYTVYVNPYLVYNSKENQDYGYSKHYYVGSERVASAIGGGQINGNQSTESLTVHPLWNVLNDYLSDMSISINGYDGYNANEGEPLYSEPSDCDDAFGDDSHDLNNCICAHFPASAGSYGISCDDFRPIYWYHPDYLGNTEFVTDNGGRPYQHFYYSPFGEEIVEQEPHNGAYNSPYHFNAKEVDPETGYHYYGARYYNSNLSVWLSVDPKADKYPSLSAFAMVANNPVRLIDPNGMEIEYGGETRKERREVRRDVREAKRSSKEFREDFNKLRQSDETYVITKSKEDDVGGSTTTDGDKILIAYSHSSEGNLQGDGELTSLFHEAKHGVQFEEGRIGFRNYRGKWTSVNRDLSDELEGFQAGTNAPGVVLSRNGQMTFSGDASNVFTRSKGNLNRSGRDFINTWYGNNPNASYHDLIPSELNNKNLKRIKNASYYMLPKS